MLPSSQVLRTLKGSDVIFTVLQVQTVTIKRGQSCTWWKAELRLSNHPSLALSSWPVSLLSILSYPLYHPTTLLTVILAPVIHKLPSQVRVRTILQLILTWGLFLSLSLTLFTHLQGGSELQPPQLPWLRISYSSTLSPTHPWTPTAITSSSHCLLHL